MNRVIPALILILLAVSSSAKPRTIGNPASATTELGRQVAAHVVYPTVLRKGNHEGIVVITFSISDENRLSRLTVHTANGALNDEITRQLVGKKLRLNDANPFETYTVRLHFKR